MSITKAWRLIFGLALGLAVASGAHAAPLSYQFTTAGQTGRLGPSQAQTDAAYTGTSLQGLVTTTGGIQSFTVQKTGEYFISAAGAQGASPNRGVFGGLGALIQGEFFLTAGQVIQIAVGQKGVSDEGDGGGGGGSFVVDALNNPLLIAGGGGGLRTSAGQNGDDGQAGQYGTTGVTTQPTGTPNNVKSTGLGLGGSSSSSWGAGGAGFFGKGQDDIDTVFGSGTYGFGGNSWANGITGGLAVAGTADGGFGGGGSGNGSFGGGGGGGYSGGDGGYIAGGGGSFNTGLNTVGYSGYQPGDGFVSILEVPELNPASALSAVALLASAMTLARHRRRAA